MPLLDVLATSRVSLRFAVGAAIAGFALWARPLLAEHPGAAIYRSQCAACHGEDGQGDVGGYEQPLFGDRSVESLARLIDRTMPQDDPEACTGDDARHVAQYIYDEFYSLTARQKKGLATAPRIELLRLTVPQHRNAVADLVGRFTPSVESAGSFDERGFRAEYYESKGMNKADDLKQDRVDARIDFDFGEGGPAENIAADQFTIIWEGALFAPDTGDYEFRIRTPNGARLYLNSDPPEGRRKLRDDSEVAGQAALIDAWVSSGQMREETARVFLLGGRYYPIRLEFFKYKDKVSSIQLEWKPPHGVWTVLDKSHVVTAAVPRTFALATPFPADDRSLGYERGASISNQWQAAVTAAAADTAREIVDRIPHLLDVDDKDPDRAEKLQAFVIEFARAAFRRPLLEEETELLRGELFTGAESPEAGVRRCVLFVLTSPYFLYTDLTPVGEAPDSFAVANRLALVLWDSVPDESLWEAAVNGELQTRDQVRAQAERMLSDVRAHNKLRDFFHHWLELDEGDLTKDRELFPEFDQALVADLRTSLEQFINQVVWSESSDYRQLLLADSMLLNDRLLQFYRPSELVSDTAEDRAQDQNDASRAEPHDEDFREVHFSPERRAGLLTHPYLLSAFSYHDNTSPIHRGVFLTRNIVGRSLRPPPVAVAFKNDEFDPDLTMREKITQLTSDHACMSCHSVINPLGFALENFDAVGRWRTEDNEKPVDPSSEYVTEDGEKLEVQSARDIASFAATSESAHRAFVVQLFHHLVKQPPAAYGAETVEELRQGFAEDNCHIQRLVIRIATLAATEGLSHDNPSEP